MEGAVELPDSLGRRGAGHLPYVATFRLLDPAVIRGVAQALAELAADADESTSRRVQSVIDCLSLPALALAITSGAGWKHT